MTQLSKQLSEHLVAAELARRGIVATPYLWKRSRYWYSRILKCKSNSVQFKSAKTGILTVANVERDYLILKQEVNFQGVIAKKEMTQWKKD